MLTRNLDYKKELAEFAKRHNLSKAAALKQLIDMYELRSVDLLITQIKLKTETGLDLMTLTKLRVLCSFLQARLH